MTIDSIKATILDIIHAEGICNRVQILCYLSGDIKADDKLNLYFRIVDAFHELLADKTIQSELIDGHNWYFLAGDLTA